MRTWLIFLVIAPPIAGIAQEQSPRSLHAAHEMSEIPSLTPTELEQLRNGDGMGLARPAELNHFPGPKHVLELAPELGLTPEQQTRAEEIFAEMQQRARDLGEQIIEAERHLNMQFAHRHVDEAALRESTASIAELYGRLRFAHLVAHLAVGSLLEASQVEVYDGLRGYAGTR